MRNPYKISRTPYCTGCGVTFDKMHQMINHRRSFRCGGRFLPIDEHVLWLAQKQYMQTHDTNMERRQSGWVSRLVEPGYYYKMSRRFLIEVIDLRKVRLNEHQPQA